MALKYYFDLMSQPSRAVYIFLKANKIPFEEKPVALRKGVHMSEDFKKINPFSKVPFIDDNGFILTESSAVLKYLCGKYKVGDNWYPKNDLKRAARIDEYLQWHNIYTRQNAAMVFQHLLLIPRMTGKPINEKQLEKQKKGLKETISFLDTYFLKGKPYISGEDISIADIQAVCELMQLDSVLEDHFYKNNVAVNTWVERVKGRLNPHFEESHKMVYKLRDMYPSMKANL